MCAHAALLALSGEPCQYTESWGDYSCIGLTVYGSSARTDTGDYDGGYYTQCPGGTERGERKKRTGRGEYDAAATERFSSGLVRLLHSSRRVFDSKETTSVGWGSIKPFSKIVQQSGTHDSAFTRIVLVNISPVASSSVLEDTMPA